jgi:hypothetical protein
MDSPQLYAHCFLRAWRSIARNVSAVADKPARLLSVKKAAAEYGIPYTTLRDLHFKGELPVVKAGRAWCADRKSGTRL